MSMPLGSPANILERPSEPRISSSAGHRVSRARLSVRFFIAATLALLPAIAQGQEKQERIAGNFHTPSVRTSDLTNGPIARIENPKEPKSDSPCLKILVTPDGAIVAHGLDYMNSVGWIAANRAQSHKTSFAQSPASEVTYDIRCGQGSGFCVEDEHNRLFVASNWHVYECSKKEAEDQMITRYAADIAVIPLNEIYQAPDIASLPKAALAPPTITNENLCQYELCLHGFGGDLFTVTSKPIKVQMHYEFEGSVSMVNLFALLVPTEKEIHEYQYKGMSGSPLTLTATGDIAGIFHRRHVMLGKSLLIFSGPDNVREAIFAASAREELEAQAQKNVLSATADLSGK